MSRAFIKSFVAAADVAAFLIVKASAPTTATTVTTAAAATDAIVGITDSLGGVSGKAMDVVLDGPAEVRLGGNVSFGDPLTSDANGKAIKAVGAANTVKVVVAWALAPGAADDIIPVRVAPSLLQLPA